jgi:hypothetical protein
MNFDAKNESQRFLLTILRQFSDLLPKIAQKDVEFHPCDFVPGGI